MRKTRIIIIGGGFAGLKLIEKLKKQKDYEILLVDINNYNFFPPLIYQVATGFMEPSAISYPFRKMLSGISNVRFRMGTLEKVVPAENKVILNNGELTYDILVMATGTESNYFGMENVQKNATPMKTISDALLLRNRLLMHLEEASKTQNIQERHVLLTTVIAGAGPTGVELAGMFAEMARDILDKDYPEFAKRRAGSIVLVDGAPMVLPPMSQKSRQYTYDKLKSMGVKIMLNLHVEDYCNDIVTLSNGRTIKAKNLIWTAGVKAKIFEGFTKEDFGRGGRLQVTSTNRLINYDNIFALGDTSIMSTDAGFPDGHPQLAQVALQQATNLGNNLKKKDLADWTPFSYRDKGTMAIIGRNKAVADIPKPKKHFSGFPAWFIWGFIHIMSLVTLRNKITAFYNWVISYISKDQAYRMIIQPKEKIGDL